MSRATSPHGPAAVALALLIALPAVACEAAEDGATAAAEGAADPAAAAAPGQDGAKHDAGIDAILALIPEADPAWGEYLAGDCRTCHREGAAGEGIPDIWTWQGEAIAVLLADYRAGLLENPAMQTVARRYGDAEIAAIAAYFDSRH